MEEVVSGVVSGRTDFLVLEAAEPMVACLRGRVGVGGGLSAHSQVECDHLKPPTRQHPSID